MEALHKRGRLGLLDAWHDSEIRALLEPFLGHHGRPVSGTGGTPFEQGLFGKDRVGLDVATELVGLVQTLLPVDPPPPPPRGWGAATWPLAELAALADWIALRQGSRNRLSRPPSLDTQVAAIVRIIRVHSSTQASPAIRKRLKDLLACGAGRLGSLDAIEQPIHRASGQLFDWPCDRRRSRRSGDDRRRHRSQGGLLCRPRAEAAGRGGDLSGRQQQMLAVARGLMAQRRILLLDEPSLGLSPLMVKETRAVIIGVWANFGAAVLLVEQNAGLALSVAERGYLMRTGRIVAAGTIDELEISARCASRTSGGAGVGSGGAGKLTIEQLVSQ